jgi:hypothetical protein
VPVGSPTEIKRALGAPFGVRSVDEKDAYMVKFLRYDKTDPTSPHSLIGLLTSLLTGQNKGFYQVDVTIEGQLKTGETFNGHGFFKGRVH